MTSARPDAPGKLRALRRLAHQEPGAQEMTVADSNHLLRHVLVTVDHLPGGRRKHTITPAGWALLAGRSDGQVVPRSANPPRPGYGIAVGDVVACSQRHPETGALTGVWHALVAGFDDAAECGERVVLEVPGRPGAMRCPLAAVSRVDPPPAAYREDLEAPAASAERKDVRTAVFQGAAYALSRADVETRMRGMAPDRITKYFVEVGGRTYPVKQVARMLTGVYEQDTSVSQKLLRDLGFVVRQTS